MSSLVFYSKKVPDMTGSRHEQQDRMLSEGVENSKPSILKKQAVHCIRISPRTLRMEKTS